MIIVVSIVLALVCVGIVIALTTHTKKDKSKQELDEKCEDRYTSVCIGCCATCRRRKGDNKNGRTGNDY